MAYIESVTTILATILLTQTGYPAIVTDKTLYATTDFRGKPAPKYDVSTWKWLYAPTAKGGVLTADALKGKVVVIDFWATWCGPCRELIPEMNEWAAKFKNDAVFIGLSDEKPEKINEFRKSTPILYNVATDETKSLSKILGVKGIPHVLVIAPDGTVRWQGWPQDDKDLLTAAKLEAIIKTSQAAAGKSGR
jgi:thiol-disulfide isomerase/thioredoxin